MLLVGIAFIFSNGKAQEDSLAKAISMKYWNISKYYPDYFEMIDKGDGFLMGVEECATPNSCTSMCFGILGVLTMHEHDLYDDKHLAFQLKYTLKDGVYTAVSDGYGTFYFKPISYKEGVLKMKVWK